MIAWSMIHEGKTDFSGMIVKLGATLAKYMYAKDHMGCFGLCHNPASVMTKYYSTSPIAVHKHYGVMKNLHCSIDNEHYSVMKSSLKY